MADRPAPSTPRPEHWPTARPSPAAVPRPVDPPAPPSATAAPGQRRAIDVDVDDRPIPVQLLGRTFYFVGSLDARRMARTLGPVQDIARELDGSKGVGEVAELTDRLMAALADLLDEPEQRDDWLSLEIPLAALIATDRPSVLGGLMLEWTGRPLDSA